MNPVDLATNLLAKPNLHVHLVGVGGVGMAGVACLLAQRGGAVSGCDLRTNKQTRWLAKKGISVVKGHSQAHISQAVDWVVRTSAVGEDHPEIRYARAEGIPVSRRGEVLPALARSRFSIAVSGTHGKTTTVALLTHLLSQSQPGIGYCIGGDVPGWDGVASDGQTLVLEADESDGTLAFYKPDIAVVTGIEFDHMEHHADESGFLNCFENFVANTSGPVIYCRDDPRAHQICGSSPQAVPYSQREVPRDLRLNNSLPGIHNLQNALAAAAVARECGLSESEICESLRSAPAPARRFETVREEAGVWIVSDYAHHPTEVKNLIQTAKRFSPRRLLAIFQPHRHTRTAALGGDFPAAFEGLDELWLLPVYPASESPIPGGTREDLRKRFPASWNGRLHSAEGARAAWENLRRCLRSGDMLLIVGAGDIGELADYIASHSNCGN